MTNSRIVVGVDGSSGSDAALDWALTEAKLRDAVVIATYVWRMNWAMGFDDHWSTDVDLLTKQAEAEVERQVDEARRRTGTASVPVEVRAEMHDQTSSALTAAAADADLLVLGSRGRGGFAGLLLGSVSAACAHHAPCPTVIIPHPA